MAATKDVVTRLKILDELLADRYHNYSLDDLTEIVSNRLAEIDASSDGVVRRTIEKDIKYIEYDGPFLAEIVRYPAPYFNKEKQKNCKKRCLRYAEPGYSIFKKELTDDEEYLLKEAISLMGQFDGLPNLDGLENLRLSLGVRANDKRIIALSKNPHESSSLFGELFTAISQKLVIELSYHKFNAPKQELTIAVHPYLLKEYNRRWFLICAAVKDGKVLTFGLDRIDKVQPLPNYKYKPFDGDINKRYDEIIGVTVYDDAPVVDICFWVSNESIGYVMTKPIHSSQHEASKEEEADMRSRYPHLQGGKLFWIHCRKNYELIRELCSFGANLLVLESTDETIKEEIFERISKIFSEYKKLRT